MAVARGDSPPRAPLATPRMGSADSATLATPRGPTFVRGDSAPGATAVLAHPLQWTATDILTRLRDAGLAPVTRGSIAPADVMGVPGIRISVAGGAGEVDGFLYADADAVGLATRRLDLGSRGTGARIASLVIDNNMAAIVITADAALRQRIAAALSTQATGRR